MNGKSKEKRISAKMTKKVLDLARQMNYKPNYLAKSLRTGKSHTIALIIADISNPFFAKFARHIEIEASKYDYKVIFANSDEKEDRFSAELEVLKTRQVDGFILIPPIGSEQDLINLQNEKVPFVVVDRLFKKVNTHTVIIDNYQAAYEATTRLIQNDRRKIAIINVNNQLFTMKQRVKGYRDALVQHGIKVNPALIKQLKFSHDKKLIMKAIQEVVKEGTDGILFTTSKLAILGLECFVELGIQIPQDLSVISFDDMDAYKVAFTPISAIVQPIEEMSMEAVRILMKMMEGSYDRDEYENVMLGVNFIYRESCV
jgi:LacI family transcriptional regulator